MHLLEMYESRWPDRDCDPDLFGRVLWDAYAGKDSEYFLRRDDDYLERDASTRYFQHWEELPRHQRLLLEHARGAVLDLGAGAGQHALVLQQRGLPVTAVDESPLAVEICRRQGIIDARIMDANALDFPDESFDTVLLMSNNLGLAGTPEGLRRLLRRLHGLVRAGGQILADISDYTHTRHPAHRGYQRQNIARGRYAGSLRLRVEYLGKHGAPFDWLLTTLSDLRTIGRESGWRIARCVQIDSSDISYAIVLEKV